LVTKRINQERLDRFGSFFLNVRNTPNEVFSEKKLESLGKTERPLFNGICLKIDFIYKWLPLVTYYIMY